VTTPEPVSLPGLGLSEIRYLKWPATTTDEPYHWWRLDAGRLLMKSQADHVIAILTKAGFKPPWIQACLDYETNHVVVCLSVEVVAAVIAKQKKTRRG
jgi:hypothetical protein